MTRAGGVAHVLRLCGAGMGDSHVPAIAATAANLQGISRSCSRVVAVPAWPRAGTHPSTRSCQPGARRAGAAPPRLLAFAPRIDMERLLMQPPYTHLQRPGTEVARHVRDCQAELQRRRRAARDGTRQARKAGARGNIASPDGLHGARPCFRRAGSSRLCRGLQLLAAHGTLHWPLHFAADQAPNAGAGPGICA